MMAADILDALHQGFREAFRSGRPEAIKAIYSDSAMILPPDRGAIAGPDAIVAFWERARRVQDIAFEPSGSERLGDEVLRETGTLLLTIQGQGQQGRQMRTRETTYLSVWRRIGGDWRLDSMMWRANNAGARQGRGNQGGRGGGRQGGGGGGGRQGGGRQGGGGGRQGAGQPGGNRRAAGGEDGPRRGNAGGFGPRAQRYRADQQAPMVPNID